MSQMLPEIFEAAGQEMAQGMEDGAGAFAKVIEDAAEKEDQCVGNELSTDAGAVKALSLIHI